MQNFVFDENTKAVLQMSQLLDFGIDPDKGYFLSSGDTNWGAFKKLFAHGKVLPSGSCYSVGLGGHICGGGDGILSRKYGITVDWLTGVEVVVKDGKDKDGKDSKDPQPARLLYVSKDSCDPEEYDLFWAHTGGGGGNFGVITKYYFKEMPKAPMGVVTSNIAFDWGKLTEEKLFDVLTWYYAFAAKEDNWDSSGKFQIMHEAAGEFQMNLYTHYFDDDGRDKALRYHGEMEFELDGLCGHVIMAGGGAHACAGHGAWFAPPKRKHKKEAGGVRTGGHDFTFFAMTQTMNSARAHL